MCPSYMVTREEKHSTRGRAHLLFEMLQGDPLKGGWKSEAVKEALDLCLACKGCKSDCPVNVDMATYKAEFLSHYYEGPAAAAARLRDGLDLLVGAARVVDAGRGQLRHPDAGPRQAAAKWLGGISTRSARCRAFATETFKDWWFRAAAAERRPAAGDPLARHVQQPLPPADRARRRSRCWRTPGFQVMVPRPSLCCGRPLYDFGMLDTAKALLRQILDTLRPEIEAGIPVVGLEPSCVAVFRDELTNLFPMDEDAKRLHEQTSSAQRVPREEGARLPRCRSSAARRWCTATATTRTS